MDEQVDTKFQSASSNEGPWNLRNQEVIQETCQCYFWIRNEDNNGMMRIKIIASVGTNEINFLQLLGFLAAAFTVIVWWIE
ncbi:hypothetical protein Glove_256g26 [Diversispora epigaea]|uniref:Uncharacterized protein n=1 Tax=Diversispora epigaea TaxID=1348612 RepID=A0A397IE69_9GLOM|nr:hypothetical protein Glove_256g26 [Diversispora epigaea]